MNQTTDIHTGSHGRYSWLVSMQLGIGHLLKHCPNAVLGRYVVITSFDSGPLGLSDTESAMGWYVDGELTYTNRLSSVEVLPYDNDDEWYVFDSPVRLVDCRDFVNAGGFTFKGPEPTDPALRAIMSKADIERLRALQTEFWAQTERFGAESYVSEGHLFLFATANQALFQDVVGAFDLDS